MNELLLAFLMSAGPMKLDAIGTQQLPGAVPSLYGARVWLELPVRAPLRPAIGVTAVHRSGSADFADVSFSTGFLSGDERCRLFVGYSASELEEVFGPATDGGARGQWTVQITLGAL